MKNKIYLSERIKAAFILLWLLDGAFTAVLGFCSGKSTALRAVFACSAALLVVGLYLFLRLIIQPYLEMRRMYRLYADGYYTETIQDYRIQADRDIERAEKALMRRFDRGELLSLSKKQAEYLALQNQINPHFLFNTLNMIYRMSLKEGADDAADMLMKTSQLLRYGLDNQKRISSLRNEIEMIGKYIEIQKKRLGKRVRFILEYGDGQEQISNISMPGMILQPLVENALQHGLHDVTENGEVVISIQQQDNVITISVSDNGKGMKPQDLEELILNDYQMKGGTHLGLYNVIRRLEMYFHDQIQISLHSDEGCGFEVFMEIRQNIQ